MEGRDLKKVDKKFIELSIYLAVLLFGVSFLGAYLGLLGRINIVENRLVGTFVDMMSFLEVGEGECDNTTLRLLGDELDRIGHLLSRGEYPDYLLKYYTLLEYKHYKMVKHFNKDCNGNFVPILFFISKNCSSECDVMAGLLTELKRKNLDKIFVYTFNTSIDSPIIRYLVTKYDVNTYPLILVDGQRCSVCSYQDLLEMAGILED